MRRIRYGFVGLAVLILAALACNVPGPPTGEPTTAPPPAEPTTETPPDVTTDPTSEVPPGETGEPTTEPPPASGVLLAPLYFIRDDGQIWRLEVDGVTLTQITTEPETVADFDISPLDGRLAYTSSNDLIVTGADGGGRTVLVTMPDVAEDDYAGRVNATIVAPTWSPVADQLAYGLGGANLYDFASSTSTLLYASDPYPTDLASLPPGPIRFFFPNAFSPDGTQLLLDFAYFPEAGGLAILDLASSTLVDVTNPDGIACCDPVWSTDSASVFFASPVAGLIPAGLWQADATTGTGVTLVPGQAADGTWSLFSHTQPLADGQLYHFFGTSTDPFPPDRPPLSMHRSGLDGVSGRTQLHTATYYPGGVLWAADGSGAALVDFTSTPDFLHGPLYWLPAGSGPALDPAVMARIILRWGVTSTP